MDILLCFVAHAGLVHIGLSRWSMMRGHGRVILFPSGLFIRMSRHLKRVTNEPVMDILLCFVAHDGFVHIGLSRWSLVRGIGCADLSP